MKLTQHEVLGMIQKEMSVPVGTIETLDGESRIRIQKRKQPSIVPSGTGRPFLTPTQHFVLGYFH
jgi:hypothetical protein